MSLIRQPKINLHFSEKFLNEYETCIQRWLVQYRDERYPPPLRVALPPENLATSAPMEISEEIMYVVTLTCTKTILAFGDPNKSCWVVDVKPADSLSEKTIIDWEAGKLGIVKRAFDASWSDIINDKDTRRLFGKVPNLNV